MSKIDKTIPVIDICSLSGGKAGQPDIIAERFASYLKVHPNLHRMHGHSFYHLVLFTKGSGFHTIDFRQYPVVAGQIYFMVPGQVHSWSFEGDVDGFVVNFSEAFFQSFLADQRYLERFDFLSGDSNEPVMALDGNALQHAVNLLQHATEEYDSTGAFHLDMLRMLVLELFIVAARNRNEAVTGSDSTHPNLVLLHNFRKLLNQFYSQLCAIDIRIVRQHSGIDGNIQRGKLQFPVGFHVGRAASNHLHAHPRTISLAGQARQHWDAVA